MSRVEVLFSEAVLRDDGTKASEISLAETLQVDWDNTRKKYKASNPDGHSECIGMGDSHTEAVIAYLRAHVGIGQKTAKVKYSSRIY